MVAPIVVLQEQRAEQPQPAASGEGLWSQTSPGEEMARRGPAQDTGIQCLSLRPEAGEQAAKPAPPLLPHRARPFLKVFTHFGGSSFAKRVFWTETHTC